MVWYRAGSMDESNGTTGVAHVLEHMMFKGTPKVGPGEFNRLVAAAGGRDNAFTSRDYTAYFQQVPADRLEEMMALEADRMRHLNLSASEFEQEIKGRHGRAPPAHRRPAAGAAVRGHECRCLQGASYRRPIIGWMDDLENMTAQDARDWYERWYVPNNAYVVIVGDVDHKAVFRAAEKYYGALRSRPLPLRKPQDEPVQTGVRRVVVKAPAELPVLVMGYRAPVVRDVERMSIRTRSICSAPSSRAWGRALQQTSGPRAAPRRFGRRRIRLDGARAGHVLPDRHALRRQKCH